MGKLCLPVFPSRYATDKANFLPCFIPDMSLIHLITLSGPTSPPTSAESHALLDKAENVKPTLLSVANVCILSGAVIHPSAD